MSNINFICSVCVIFGIIYFLDGFLLGSVGAGLYVKSINDERTYSPWNTTCYILNHSYVQRQCQSCGGLNSCFYYTCYDENTLVSYKIFNKSIVTSTIVTKGLTELQAEIGLNKTCYYDGKNNIQSVRWKYDDKTAVFILLCVGYGVAGVALIALIIGTLYPRRDSIWIKINNYKIKLSSKFSDYIHKIDQQEI